MSQAYVHELWLAGLSIGEFNEVMRVYGQYVADTWYTHGLHGVKLVNVPLVALDGLSTAVANVEPLPGGFGVPDDSAPYTSDGQIDSQARLPQD